MSKCKKLVYADEGKALKTASLVVKSGRAKQNRAYHCQACKGWHLTSQSVKAFKADRKSSLPPSLTTESVQHGLKDAK